MQFCPNFFFHIETRPISHLCNEKCKGSNYLKKHIMKNVYSKKIINEKVSLLSIIQLDSFIRIVYKSLSMDTKENKYEKLGVCTSLSLNKIGSMNKFSIT